MVLMPLKLPEGNVRVLQAKTVTVGGAGRVGFVGERTVVGGEGGRRWRGHDGLDAVAIIDHAAAEAGNINLRAGLPIVRDAGSVRGHAAGAHATGEIDVVLAERRSARGGLPNRTSAGKAAQAIL